MNENIVNLPKSARLDRSLSSNERERLLRAARLRDKVAKTAAAERSAVLLADFEQQLASVYSFDQSEIWAQAYQAARKAIDTASRAVAEECDRLGIPKRFAPDIGGAQWYGRGENTVRERRVELRKVAQTRIAVIEKHARSGLERISSEVQIELLAHGMSETALRLLEQLPKVQLMPTLTVPEVDAVLRSQALLPSRC